MSLSRLQVDLQVQFVSEQTIMKYFILLASLAAATPYPHYDLSFPLQKRVMRMQGGKQKVSKGKGLLRPEPIIKKQGSPKPGDTRASAKSTGPGLVATGRHQDENPNQVHLVAGQRQELSTHDPIWSKAQAQQTGRPPANAQRQDPRLHPVKVEGEGNRGHARLNAPQGGYGKLKKEVDGEVVRDERIRGGESAEDFHNGPGRVTYSASTSKGGDAFVQVNNMPGDAHQARLNEGV